MGVALALVSLIATHWDVPAWVWVAVAIIGVFVAQFDAWLRMRAQRDAAVESREPTNIVTLVHRVTGQWLQVQVTNKLATIHNARVNVLVPNRPGIVASRLRGGCR